MVDIPQKPPTPLPNSGLVSKAGPMDAAKQKSGLLANVNNFANSIKPLNKPMSNAQILAKLQFKLGNQTLDWNAAANKAGNSSEFGMSLGNTLKSLATKTEFSSFRKDATENLAHDIDKPIVIDFNQVSNTTIAKISKQAKTKEAAIEGKQTEGKVAKGPTIKSETLFVVGQAGNKTIEGGISDQAVSKKGEMGSPENGEPVGIGVSDLSIGKGLALLNMITDKEGIPYNTGE